MVEISRYSYSLFDINSKFLLRKITGRGLQLYSKTNLNHTSELYLRGPNNASGLWNILMEVERVLRSVLEINIQPLYCTFLKIFFKPQN